MVEISWNKKINLFTGDLMKSLFLYTFTLLVWSTNAFRVEVPAGEEVKFYEVLKKNDKMGINFQVEEGGNYDIDIKILDPKGEIIYAGQKESYGTYSFSAKYDGKYEFSFDNSMSQVTPKKLSFNVLGRGESTIDSDSVHQEMRDLNESLRKLKDDQDDLIHRSKLQHDVASGTNSRLFWWALFQVILLVALCCWKIYYLKTFFEVRRIV